MTVPNAVRAVLPAEKLSRYLLDVSHAVGGPKARFLRAHGFSESNAALLATGLRAIAAEGDGTEHPSPFGTKYVVTGDLPTPRGILVRMTTVWIVEPGDDRPRFVTAYPAPRPSALS